jgi:hypothetical protein
MKKLVFLTGTALICAFTLLLTAPVQGAQDLKIVKVDKAPTLDGTADDAAWSSAKAVTVTDYRDKDKITLKAVLNGDMVFFLVTFPDKEENALHKPWVWDKEMGVYTLGPQREDGFTFKWNMETGDVDLSNFSDDSYKADVWYWKAGRTNPAGYADDKHHVLADSAGKSAKELKSTSGKTKYLMRIGDAGTSAQKKRILTDYQGDVQDQYESRKPDGSRADVMAKGVWKAGAWTIEFARKLDTGHDDDLKMDASSGSRYLFGVSVYGLYGDDVDDSKPHLYGQGRISEKLYLVFP